MAVRRLRRRVADVNSGSCMARKGSWYLLAFVFVVTGIPSHAAEWEIEPQLRLSETWTDNYGLSTQDPEEEWITEIAPGVRVSGEGRRVDLDLAYRMQSLVHARESERNRINHLLSADGGIELVRERLFFNADATSSIGSGQGGLVSTTSNTIAADQRERVTTWSAGPRFQYRLGSAAALEAELRRQHVDFGSRTEGDSDADVLTAGLTSGPLFTTWGWAIDYTRRDESITRDSTGGGDEFVEETKLERLRSELNLRASAATQLFVAGGTERNEFETAQAGDPVDGDFWEAGFRWSPSRTVSLEAATGERFFGNTARGSLSIRGSALDLQLGYSETVVTTPQLQFERQTVLLVDDDGNPVVGPDGQPATAVITVPAVRDDVIVQERANVRLTWDYSHTTASLSFIATDREFQREGTFEQTRQSNLDIGWARLPRTTVTGGIGFRERESTNRSGVEETTSVRLGAIRRLSTQADAELEMEHVSQARRADSNRITAALNMRF